MREIKIPRIGRLLKLKTALGSELTQSLESVAVSNNIKREASFSIELFDEAIRSAVNEFYEFSAVYRENNTDRFIEDVRTLEQTLSNNSRKYIDTIRWSDDENHIKQLRRPVSSSYLAIFGELDQNKQVTPNDFWKCLDLNQLCQEIYRAPDFQRVSTLFTGEKAWDDVNKLLELVTNIRLDCVKLSEQYEKTIAAILERLLRGDSIPKTDTINFNATSATVLGNHVTASIVQTLNNKWYGRNLETPIGSMASDVALLLGDPLKLCSPENSDNPKAVLNLFTYVKAEHSADNIRTLQREFMNIVEQIDLSSRRLSKLAEGVSEIPDYNGDGGYNYVLRDVTMLMHVYSATLAELLKFIVQIAILLEQSYQSVNTLNKQVTVLKNEIDNYVNKRLKE